MAAADDETPEERAARLDDEQKTRTAALAAAVADLTTKELALEAQRAANKKALDDAVSPLAQRAADAEHEKAIALAEKEKASALKEAVAGWVPDLSGVTGGTTKIEDGKAIYGPRLAAAAMQDAAHTIAADIGEEVAQAAVGLIPDVISLLATDRTLSYSSVDLDVMAAHAAVVHELLALKVADLAVTHDTFRTMSGALIVDTTRELNGALRDLATALAYTTAFIGAHPVSELAKDASATVKKQHADQQARLDRATALKTELTTMTEDIAKLLAELLSVPTGASRTLLATVAMREQLGVGAGRFDAVLLIAKPTIESQQALSDRKIGWDTVSVGASAVVSYMLLDTFDGRLVAGGLARGQSGMHGRVGRELKLENTAEPTGTRIAWLALLRGALVAAAGALVLFSPGVELRTLLVAFAIFAGADAVLLLVQGVLGGRRAGNAWLLAEAIGAGVVAAVAATNTLGDLTPWVLPVYLLLHGVLGLLGRAGVRGRVASTLVVLAGAIALVAAAGTGFALVANPALLLPMLGIFGVFAGLCLIVASAQDVEPEEVAAARLERQQEADRELELKRKTADILSLIGDQRVVPEPVKPTE